MGLPLTPYLEDADFTLYQGDALTVLRELQSESVHCCVTSPPYWGLRDYGTAGQLGLEATPEEYVARMVEVFREVRRVLRGDGTLWLNIGDSYNSAASNDWSKWKGGQTVRHETRGAGVVASLKPKDLVGIPWRLAFALQADGWYLRADIIWAKPNPMPESVTDRPTKAHEYLFLLAKQPRYFFDQEAVREPAAWERWGDQTNRKHEGSGSAAGWIGSKPKTQLQGGRHARRYSAEEFKTTEERNTRFQGPNPADGGRNVRSVWEIATQPFSDWTKTSRRERVELDAPVDGKKRTRSPDCPVHGDRLAPAPTAGTPGHSGCTCEWYVEYTGETSHFATYPEELVRRCILAGTSERGCCPECGKPWEREVERGESDYARLKREQGHEWTDMDAAGLQRGVITQAGEGGQTRTAHGTVPSLRPAPTRELGWRPCCKCERDDVVPATVLDCFLGSGTTALVARKHGRRTIGIELSPDYCKLAARRLSQLSLLAGDAA